MKYIKPQPDTRLFIQLNKFEMKKKLFPSEKKNPERKEKKKKLIIESTRFIEFDRQSHKTYIKCLHMGICVSVYMCEKLK